MIMIEWPAEPNGKDSHFEEYVPPKKPWYVYLKQIILFTLVLISFVLIQNGRLIKEEGYGLILSGLALMVISTVFLIADSPVRQTETVTITKGICTNCKKEYAFDFKPGDTVYSEICKCAFCQYPVEIVSIFDVNLLPNGKAREKEMILMKEAGDAQKKSNNVK